MSARDQAVAAILTQVALAADGAVLGVALAYVAVRSFIKYASSSSSLKRITNAPSINVSDLRSLITDEDSADCDGGDGDGGGKLVVVRGTVEAKSAVLNDSGSWKNALWSGDVLLTSKSREEAVVIQRTQRCIYNEWRGFIGWTSDLRAILAKAWREQESSSTRKVPFVLVDGCQHPHLDYAVVNLDGSKHPLPLITVYHQMQPINASPYTVLQALFGHEYPVGILEEEKILPLGKDITAVGICCRKNGSFEIKSCRDLPYFLSEMTKDQMVVEMSFRTKILFWSGIVVGSLSVGVLGYAIVRNWNRWKQWREQRAEQRARSQESESMVIEDEDVGDVPDGQLCVICLMRRRRSAFVPCGHLVCCQRCALSVERELSPKCPVCRQTIRHSVRIYDS